MDLWLAHRVVTGPGRTNFLSGRGSSEVNWSICRWKEFISEMWVYFLLPGHGTPAFGDVTGPRPLYTNFCTRCPRYVSVV